MKKNKHDFRDILFVILLITSFFFLINPFGIIMTNDLEMLVLGVMSLIVVAILVFMWKEDPVDEREEIHLLVAGRVSFFSTASILLVVLIVQTLQHNVDEWIPIILFVLLSSKILSVVYLKYKK
jgi:hypothetical protein